MLGAREEKGEEGGASFRGEGALRCMLGPGAVRKGFGEGGVPLDWTTGGGLYGGRAAVPCVNPVPIDGTAV
jgi:hypothetical protein